MCEVRFRTNHPIIHKKGVIISLIDKIFKISDPAFHQKNLEPIISILLNNCYPLDLIFSVINKRLQTSLHGKNTTHTQDKNDRKSSFFVPTFLINFFQF